MRGEFTAVWAETWRHIWQPLAKHSSTKGDLFCELYRAASLAFEKPLTVEALAEIIDDPARSRACFRQLKSNSWASERALVEFLQDVHATLLDFNGETHANAYFIFLRRFVEKYNLRYDLRRPCALCPTLPGMFASLIDNLRAKAKGDAHLHALLRDFDESVRDLRHGFTEGRIKTCIQKQVNLLEAMGRAVPGVSGFSFTDICNQVDSWPHERVKMAMKDLYQFTCDYPGIRHAGMPDGALRKIDMRDMLAMSVLLAGFMPYLAGKTDAEAVYLGRA